MEHHEKIDFVKTLFKDDDSKMRKFRRKYPKLSEVMTFEYDNVESEKFLNL